MLAGDDANDAGAADQPDLAIGRVAAAPVREGERDEDPADQPTDVRADRDVAARAVVGEVQDEVDHDQRRSLSAEVAGVLPLENEHRAEDPEDRAGRADRRRERRLHERARRACEPRDEVEKQEACRAEIVLDGPADHPEREHVEGEVQQIAVEEHRRDQAPPVAVVDERPVHDPLHVERATGAVEPVPLHDGDQVDADVDRDEDPRHRAVEHVERRAPDDARRGDSPRISGVLGTADPDRRGGHALGADRAAALGAREAGLAVGVPVARRQARLRGRHRD